MILNINGRNMQITDSIRAHVEKKAAKLERFFRPDTEVQVRISQERGGRNIAEVTVALRGVILRAEEVTNDMYASIDTAIDKMVRQIRRHRTQLEKGLRAGAFEPAAAEVVVAMMATIMKEAIEESVRRGVPRPAAEAFLLGHIQIPLAIALKSSNPFSDAAMIAVDYGKRHVLREDWKKVFEPSYIEDVLQEMLHLK